jgi:hypothetical protein
MFWFLVGFGQCGTISLFALVYQVATLATNLLCGSSSYMTCVPGCQLPASELVLDSGSSPTSFISSLWAAEMSCSF